MMRACALYFVLLVVVGNGPNSVAVARRPNGWEPPEWWDRISEQDTTGLLRKCKRRPPRNGRRCGWRHKICYSGTQECDQVGAHPLFRCECLSSTWDCVPESCPTEQQGCGTEDDCTGGEMCFSPEDSFCGVCLTDPPSCLTDDDCPEGFGDVFGGAGGLFCDNRKIPCHCNGFGPTCNTACTVDTDCGAGDTCLPDGHCAPTLCELDADCVDNFACSSALTCVRRTCTDDEECTVDGGFCVKGQCFSERGFCSFPPP